MRNHILLTIVLLITFSFALANQIESSHSKSRQTQTPGFLITGTIKGLDYPYIYFRHNEDGVGRFDSCRLVDGGFTFKGKVSEPQTVFLYTKDGKLQKVFYAENVVMKVIGDASALDKIVVSGPKTQADFVILEARVKEHRAKVIALYDASEKAKNEGDSVLMRTKKTEADALYHIESEVRKQFIIDYPNSMVSLDELMNFSNNKNYKEGQTLYTALNDRIKNTEKGKEVAQHIANLDAVKIGMPFIDFTQNDANGTPISLSSFKGKYVLLEFWASWCGPCRGENPNLKLAYSKYNAKGFNIFGVSLDDDANKWKKALEKDNLPWTQVADLKGWNNLAAKQYGVRAIPANYLIDPAGNIIQVNLRGEDLNKVLAELFK